MLQCPLTTAYKCSYGKEPSKQEPTFIISSSSYTARGSPWHAGLAPASRLQGMTGSVSQQPLCFPSPISKVWGHAGGCEDTASLRGLRDSSLGLQGPLWVAVSAASLCRLRYLAPSSSYRLCPVRYGHFFSAQSEFRGLFAQRSSWRKGDEAVRGIFTSSSRKAQILKGRGK